MIMEINNKKNTNINGILKIKLDLSKNLKKITPLIKKKNHITIKTLQWVEHYIL